jgi:hypothetical protein
VGQTKDYQIGICCFSVKHTMLRRKGKDWLAQNQDNVSEWGDMAKRVYCGVLQEIYFTKRNKHSIHHNLKKVSE